MAVKVKSVLWLLFFAASLQLLQRTEINVEFVAERLPPNFCSYASNVIFLLLSLPLPFKKRKTFHMNK